MQPDPTFEFRRVEHNTQTSDTRAIIRLVVDPDGTKHVQLHMPHLAYWSPIMSIDDAVGLIARDFKLFPDQHTVEVIDDDGEWPSYWPGLSK